MHDAGRGSLRPHLAFASDRNPLPIIASEPCPHTRRPNAANCTQIWRFPSKHFQLGMERIIARIVNRLDLLRTGP